MGELRDDLLTAGTELEETHISWVFLRERDVYKIKKPVDLGFLDFTTLRKRRRACEMEVCLNRRLAPEVYLAVVPVTRDEAGRHRIGGEGQAVDWAVHMRRLRHADRADVRLQAERLSGADVTVIAEHVARFHAQARCDEETARFGRPEAIADNVKENFRQMGDRVGAYLSEEESREVEAWQRTFLSRNRRRFEERIENGRIRDGHGDLRLEHVYVSRSRRESPVIIIIDCIEFNERFRYADVCADIAFLSMDLAWHGHVDLAEHLLADYARDSNDYDLYPLVDFYQSYRATVRGKVASMLAADEGAETETRSRARAEAHRYLKLALASERPSLLDPVLVAVGGPIAAGKSTIAEWIAGELSCPVIDSDRTRKFLLGVSPTQKVHDPAFTGAYTPEMTERVYGEVLRRADAVLGSGRPAVLDASFRSRKERAAARELAADRSMPFYFVECAADRQVLYERLVERERTTGVSDGRIEILDEFLASWEAVDELPPEALLRLDTTRPLGENVEVLRAQLPLWPERLP